MIEENLNTLHAIERCVARTWRQQPALTDHMVKRIYEGLAAHYRALASGREPVDPTTDADGAEGEVFTRLLALCEELRQSGAAEIGAADEKEERGDPLDAETLHRCLRRLMRSVDKATKRGGVQGYLTFIQQFTR